ncbi:MAG TPA: hypothetical protein VLB29_05060 [Nocardioidaceae bacterium]|nr:hypothetical protein [Nocardioidaceae bacterium]
MPSTSVREAAPPRASTRAAAWGLLAAAALLASAIALPALTGWNVRVRWFPPLHAEWDPRLGPGTLPAIGVAALAGWQAVPLARRLPWSRLLLATWLAGIAWMLSLALVDGPDGIGRILEHDYEYLETARATTDVPATLREYVDRIPYSHPDNWPVHIAGHPPGALLLFVGLVRIGLGGWFAAGLVVVLVAATTPLAVLVVARVLGAEERARVALPFLVLGPAAIWQAVSADAMFAAIVAWGMASLAVAATRRSIGWSVVAGLVLGYSVMLSYGLPLVGILAVAVLSAARSWFPLLIAAAAAAAVVLAFAALGFAWWEGLSVLHERYWDGVASRRPTAYWLWGNLAALVACAGPLLGAALSSSGGSLLAALRRPRRDVLATLALAGVAMVLAADLSLMSKAEVERIWLPFVPWIMLSCAFLPPRWVRPGLLLQLGFALVVQHLLWSDW